MPLPSLTGNPIKYGKVTWTGLVSAMDSLDEDDNPDIDAITGTIIFKPSAPYLKSPSSTPKFTVALMNRQVNIADAQIDEQGRKYIKLEASVGDVQPDSFTWTAVFNLAYKGVFVTIPNATFQLLEGQEIDLTDHIPPADSAAPTSPMVNDVFIARSQAVAARDEAIEARDEAVEAVSGIPTEVLTIPVADATYAPAAVADQVAGKLDQTTADGRYAPMIDTRVPAANLPALFRTTDSQPFAADSIWNTPIGKGATFESADAPATASFLAATPVINDTLNGYGFYLNVARPTDPLGTGSYVSSSGNTTSFTHRIPYDPVISAGSDGSMRIIDGRFAYDYWKTVKVNDTTYTADFITRTDLLGTGRNTGTRAARFPTSGGLIRSHELSKCYIPHALCISIPPAALKRGFVWPAAAEDAVGVTYSGEVPMGSFFAIPPSVNISSLGLSQEGYALAECLQNYGMYVGDASDSAAIYVDGEAAVSMRSALERMRTDWATIFPQLRMVTNVGTTAGGPGARRVPASGPVTVRTDSQEVLIDVLTSRVRAQGGGMLTSEDCKTAVDPIVSTNAGNGGASFNWTGYTAQYRISDGAIRRIASPDGSTRALLINIGRHNVRIEATVKARQSSGNAYLVAGGTDSSNAFRLNWTSSGSVLLQSVTSGTGPGFPGSSLPAGTVKATGTRVGLMVYGPSIYGLIDGEIVSEAISTENATGTYCGLLLPSDTTVALSDLTVRAVPRLFRKPISEA
ncbi:minor tail protein [Gordonia phage Luker]|uniref:Minor tail protein n=1 Tax=Gordonia phage Luker TaxID=2591188 RepID=A0A514A4Q4_9CAUD|nr:minor tail protein [Gordonia phage Luker]